jgi:hypothetical protein
MDALNMVVQVPSWAYDFCYYYLAVAAVVVVYSLYSIFQLLTLPAVVQKVVPVASLTISLLISGAVATLLTMMQFWICRSALAPRRLAEKFASQNMGGVMRGPVGIEQFAVQCKTSEDCLGVAGTQNGRSNCGCGERGLCAGCVMNSNMKDDYDPAYGEPLPAFSDTLHSRNQY